MQARGGFAVLVLAPFARDAALTCEFLNKAGLEARSCGNIDELCRMLGEGPGAALIMEEALAGDALARLLAALERQPRWSDIPVLIVVDAHHKPDDTRVRRFTDALGNLTLITRPAHPVTLLSSVRSALRGRERQYRLRDALGPYEESYRRLVEAMPLATFVQLDGRVIYANPAAAALVGAPNADAVAGHPVTRWIHPAFVAEAERCVAALAARGAAPPPAVQRWRRADGSELDVEVDMASMIWGRRPAVRITAQEIGTRRADERLAALEHVRVMLFEQDRELRYTWIHGGILDRPAEEQVIGRRDADLLPCSAEAEALEAFKREVMASGSGAQRSFRLTLNDRARHFDVRIEPRRDAHGAVTGLAGTAVDISEHAALEEQLRSQAEQLVQADRRKNDFLAQLGHELRNPLAPIHNAVHVLRIQPEPPDPTHYKWAIEVIARQVQHLTRLIDDLLDVARIAHGRVALRWETVELGRALAQAIEAAGPLTTARRQTLTYSPPVEPLRVRADPARLVQVVGNLLDNAARYTPAGGHIALWARREDNQALISVKDDGIGIPPDALERIFEPFQHGAPPPDAAHAGLGIGLALVKHLVELHAGTVEAHSEGPGLGSEFLVRLSMAAAPAEVAPPEPRKDAGWRVLVVDDDRDVAQSFALLLGLMGYQVRSANDGAGGLKSATSFHPHVVFIDIGLPDMDGYALARALRAANPDFPMRLVALTGYTQEEVRERVVTAGFDAHLLKPVSTDTVERLLESFRVAD